MMRKPIFTAMTLLVVAALAIAQQSTPQSPGASAFTVKGMVVDSRALQPLAGVTVALASTTERQRVRTEKTDANGEFAFAEVPQAKYQFSASRRGYSMQSYDQHDQYSSAIVTGPDLDTEHLVFRLKADAAIRGRIIDEQGEPVPNATIRLFQTRSDFGRRETRVVNAVTTDDRGEYAFEHLQEGRYYVAASGRPWYAANRIQLHEALAEESAKLNVAYAMTFQDGSTDTNQASPLVLRPGDMTNADIVLRAVRAVRLRFPRTEPLEPQPAQQRGIVGVTAMPQPPNVQLLQQMFDGSFVRVESYLEGSQEGFQLSGVAPGHYLLQVSPTGGKRAEAATMEEIDLTGDMEYQPSHATTQASVSGVVRSEGSVSGMYVRLVSLYGGPRGYGAPVREKGEFEIERGVAPGKYDVIAANVRDAFVSSISATGAKVVNNTVHIGGSQAVHLNISVARGFAQIEGLTRSDGKPFSGAMVVLVPRDPGNGLLLFRRDQSDSDGTFLLRDVVPGKYTIIAIEDAWELSWADPKVLQPFVKNGETLEVTANSKLRATVTVQKRAEGR